MGVDWSAHLLFGIPLGSPRGLDVDIDDVEEMIQKFGCELDPAEWIARELAYAGGFVEKYDSRAPDFDAVEWHNRESKARRGLAVLQAGVQGDTFYLCSRDFSAWNVETTVISDLEVPPNSDEDFVWACDVLGMKRVKPAWLLTSGLD